MPLNPTTEVFGLEPEASVKWFQSKGYALTFDWRDMAAEEHAYAFTVAKCAQLDVLATMREGVDAAIKNGTTFAEFQKTVRPQLQAKGWWGEKEQTDPVTGEVKLVQLGSPRRLKTIYDTNLRTSHAAGKWQRIEDSARTRPYLRYVTRGEGKNRRAEHQALRDIVRPVSDPIWSEIYPPNGWGCACSVQQLSERDVKRLKLEVSEPVELEYVNYTNKRTGETSRVPKGVDPGWNYNVGMARKPNAPLGNIPTLTPSRNFADYGRPKAKDVTQGLRSSPPQSDGSPKEVFRKVFGTSDSKSSTLISDKEGYQVAFSEEQYLAHVGPKADNRQRWFPHAKDVVEDPFEVWLVPHRRKDGSVVLRRRYIGLFKQEGAAKPVLVVVDDNGAITSFPTNRIDRQREGYLHYSREEKVP